MRIIGGKYSRRSIWPPKNLPVRPTTDLAKEGLFNILRHRLDFDGKTALDLFAGTGSISYEFASRGCAQVISVDMNPRCIRFIRETAQDLNMQLKAIRSDAFRFIKSSQMSYDLIFCDPPYDLPDIDNISKLVFENERLSPGGILIVEHAGTVDLSEQEMFTDHRRYGHVNFSFFQLKA